MTRINQEEYEVLKELDDKWKWIARDEDKTLWAYTEIPVRKSESNVPYYWDTEAEKLYSTLDLYDERRLFQFIQWRDEPYNIAELIREYEFWNGTGSEETEVKTKQELIEEWESAIEAAEFYGKGKEERLISYMKDFVSDLNRLDEPEVLSREWISENVEYAYFDMLDGSGRLSSATAIIKPKKLQNLLVPELEEVDRAYRKGFKEGERQTAEYFESITEEPSKEQVWKYLSENGIEVVNKEPETVADVVTTFWKSYERLKEVMSMEVKELEE